MGLPGVVWAQDMPAKPTMEIQVKQMNLSAQAGAFGSGLQVLAMPDPATRHVAVTIVVDAGWRTDPDGRSGAARLFERAWWRSEVKPGVTTLDQLVRGYGCEVDSGVSADVLRFSALCPAQTVDAAMRVWSRLYTAPLAGITDAALAEEAGRVRSEARARALLDDQQLPGLVAPLYGMLFPTSHPYHQPLDLELSGVTVAELSAWATANIVGPRTTVSLIGGISDEHPLHGPALVAGNFEPKVLDARLKPEMFERWPKGDGEDIDPDDLSLSWGWPADPVKRDQGFRLLGPRPAAALKDPLEVPKPEGAAFQRYLGGVEHTTVLVGWALPAGWRTDDALHAATGRMVAGVVAKHLVDPAIDRLMGCFIQPGLESSLLVCAAQLKDGQEIAGERIAGRIVDQLSYVTDVNNRLEVDAAFGAGQQALYAEALASLDDLGGLYGSRSYWFSSGLHFAGKPMYWSQRMGDVGRATAQDAINLVASHVSRLRARMVQIDPDPGSTLLPRLAVREERDRDALAARPPYWNALATQAAPAAVPSARVDAARIEAALQGLGPDQVAEATLPNGMRVVVVPLGEAPVVHARLVAGIGRVNDPTPNLEHTWAGKMTAFHREPAEPIAGAWYAWLGDSVQVLGLRASTDNLDGALFLLRDAVNGANPSLKTKITVTAEFKDRFVAEFYDPAWHAERASLAHLLSSSPIARRPGPAQLTAWGALSTTAIGDMMKTQWRPDNVTLLIVGGVDAAAGVELAKAWFSGWSVGAPSVSTYKATPLAQAPRPTSTRVDVLDTGAGDRADLYLGCRLDADPGVLAVAREAVLQGLKGGIDGVVVTTDAWEGGTAILQVRARVQAGDAGEATKGLFDRLRALAGGKVPAEEIKEAALRAAASTGADFSSDRRLVTWLTDRLADRLPLTGQLRVPTDGAALTAAFQTCVAGGYASLTGDAGAIESSLGAAGVTATRLDWKAEGRKLHEAADPKGYLKESKKAP
jgi:predicted Zn-dependent peptidase